MPCTTIAYKFRLHTDEEQDKLLKLHSSFNRSVYNHFNAICRANFKQGKDIPGKFSNINELVKLKRTERFSYLKEANSQSLQQVLIQLEENWKRFFERLKENKKKHKYKFLKPPQFKKKNKDIVSIVIPQHFTINIDTNEITLPKLGTFKFKRSKRIFYNNDQYRDIPKQILLKYDRGFWYVCITIIRHTFKALPKTDSVIGIDLGVKHFASSTERKFYDLKIDFDHYFNKIKRLNQILSNKVKDSKNYNKIKDKLGKIHQHIRNIRYDFLQKLSTTLVKNHDEIVLEKLETSDMVNKDKKKSSVWLRKSILQQGWSKFMLMLEYKFNMYRDTIVNYIDPKNTSKTCFKCKYIDKRNRKGEEFKCVKCGYQDHADLNAANNILYKYLNPCHED